MPDFAHNAISIDQEGLAVHAQVFLTLEVFSPMTRVLMTRLLPEPLEHAQLL